MTESASTNGFWVRDPAFYKKLLVLALPIILQNALTYSVTLADNMMVGRLGEDAISGLYLATIVQTVLQVLLNGVDAAVMILSAQYWGKKDIPRIKDVISIGMRIAITGTSILFVVILLFPGQLMNFLTTDTEAAANGAAYLRAVCPSYIFFAASQVLIMAMRSVEIVRIGLINSFVALIVNITLNYILIFGHCGAPPLGVSGAALATTISRLCELAVVLFFTLKIDKTLKLRLRDFLRWDKLILHDLIKHGTPLIMGQVVWAVNMFARTWIAGQLQSAAITAMSIADVFNRMFLMVTWGLAGATGIIVGKAIGANQFDKVRQYAKTMQVIFLSFGACAAATILLCHPFFLSFYNLEPDTKRICIQFMYVLSVIIFGQCYQAPCLFGLVKSGGDTSFVFKNDTFWVFTLVLPLSFLLLYLNAPPWMIFAALLSDQITKCFVALVKINSFNWLHNLTRPS